MGLIKGGQMGLIKGDKGVLSCEGMRELIRESERTLSVGMKGTYQEGSKGTLSGGMKGTYQDGSKGALSRRSKGTLSGGEGKLSWGMKGGG